MAGPAALKVKINGKLHKLQDYTTLCIINTLLVVSGDPSLVKVTKYVISQAKGDCTFHYVKEQISITFFFSTHTPKG